MVRLYWEARQGLEPGALKALSRGIIGSEKITMVGNRGGGKRKGRDQLGTVTVSQACECQNWSYVHCQ